MMLYFPCSNCNENITVRYLKVGEIAKCKNCGLESLCA